MSKLISVVSVAVLGVSSTLMAMPSGINYQGVLTDAQSNTVTGTRTMSIRLYDAATGGNLLYSENLGTVQIKNGVFSFEFGTAGTSNAEQSETVAMTDGAGTSFQKVLSATNVVAGSVSVGDGVYTWSQSGGSSNEDEFGVAYSTSLRRVTTSYYNGAPAADRTITATYRTPTSGITGALAGGTQPWAEITADGIAQVPRQKVVAVPYALTASSAVSASSVDSSFLGAVTKRVNIPVKQIATGSTSLGLRPSGLHNALLPLTSSWQGYWELPHLVKRVYSIQIKLDSSTSSGGTVSISLGAGVPWSQPALAADPSVRTETLAVNLDVPFGERWILTMVCSGSARVLEASIDAEVSAVAGP